MPPFAQIRTRNAGNEVALDSDPQLKSQSIVSHVTNQLGALKSLTGASQPPDFTQFTH